MSTPRDDITALLGAWSDGNQEAFAQLIAVAYDDLRAIAHRRLRQQGNGGPELSTTALVHEAYLRLAARDVATDSWEGRAHFYAFASRAMRTILVDHARRLHAKRRGGDDMQLPLQVELHAAVDGAKDVLGVDEAIEQLALRHPRMAQVVELRFFGGFSVPEVAEVLQVSVRTVEREWTRARAHLFESLRDDMDSA